MIGKPSAKVKEALENLKNNQMFRVVIDEWLTIEAEKIRKSLESEHDTEALRKKQGAAQVLRKIIET